MGAHSAVLAIHAATHCEDPFKALAHTEASLLENIFDPSESLAIGALKSHNGDTENIVVF